MKTTKVKAHLRKGKMVKAHNRASKWDKDMKDYYSSTSLKKPVFTSKFPKDFEEYIKSDGVIKKQDGKYYDQVDQYKKGYTKAQFFKYYTKEYC
jgi:hypothetical protein